MAKRFNNLDAALKLVRNTTGTGQANIDGTFLGEYLKYKTGEKVLDYTRDAASKPGEMVEVQVLAFARANTDAAIITSLSSRSEAAIANLGVSATDLNHAAVTDGQFFPGFIPAKAVFFKADATQADTLETSQITGKKYNPREGKSYTLPFGQKPSGTGVDLTYAGVASGIVGSLGEDESVSFQPEKYPMGRG